MEVYRAALEVRTRGRLPIEWARTQINLGTALSALARRESGTARLEQAEAAYRDALEVLTPRGMPLDWAATQSNLGSVLLDLDERQREDGTERIEQAVEAYRAALGIRTRERMPVDWAVTQNGLGNALQTLGKRAGDSGRLKEAVNAYRSALEVRTRKRLPLDWAETQTNLGNTLQALGKGMDDTGHLQQAEAAYRGALEVFTRDGMPFHWATTQNNLGNALQSLEGSAQERSGSSGRRWRPTERHWRCAFANDCRLSGRRRRPTSETRFSPWGWGQARPGWSSGLRTPIAALWRSSMATSRLGRVTSFGRTWTARSTVYADLKRRRRERPTDSLKRSTIRPAGNDEAREGLAWPIKGVSLILAAYGTKTGLPRSRAQFPENAAILLG